MLRSPYTSEEASVSVASIAPGILPLTAEVGPDRRLRLGGCDAVELTRRFGTPLYVYDEATIRARCREYRSAIEAVRCHDVALAG